MNTIPLTFNRRNINFAGLGGREPLKSTMPVTCIVLNRTPALLRQRTFESLVKCGFEKIISIGKNSGSFGTETLSRKFPQVNFITVLEEVTSGDMLNIAVSETSSPYVLILPQELTAGKISFNAQMAERFIQKKQFCIVPHLYTSSLQGLPVSFSPASQKSVFTVNSATSSADSSPTLYAADYAGFYDRDRFIHLGGFDYTITSDYWQKLDFFMRSWLWGEKTSVSSAFEFSYADEIPQDDRTSNLSYLRFYLKNLAPVFRVDHGYIPKHSFIRFKFRSGCGLSEALRQFKDARRWTEENQYRFKTDAASLIQNWGGK
ncbi:MAG: hypothetical protein J6Z17_02410 [Treponema sp.]|nr:hypothetical protein [Treponema sp.]